MSVYVRFPGIDRPAFMAPASLFHNSRLRRLGLFLGAAWGWALAGGAEAIPDGRAMESGPLPVRTEPLAENRVRVERIRWIADDAPFSGFNAMPRPAGREEYQALLRVDPPEGVRLFTCGRDDKPRDYSARKHVGLDADRYGWRLEFRLASGEKAPPARKPGWAGAHDLPARAREAPDLFPTGFAAPAGEPRLASFTGALEGLRARRTRTFTAVIPEEQPLATGDRAEGPVTVSLTETRGPDSVHRQLGGTLTVPEAWARPDLHAELPELLLRVEVLDGGTAIPLSLRESRQSGAGRYTFAVTTHNAPVVPGRTLRLTVNVDPERVVLPFTAPGVELPARYYLPADAPVGERGAPAAEAGPWRATLQALHDAFSGHPANWYRAPAPGKTWTVFADILAGDGAPPDGVRVDALAARLVTDTGETLSMDPAWLPLGEEPCRTGLFLASGYNRARHWRWKRAPLEMAIPMPARPADRAVTLTADAEILRVEDWGGLELALDGGDAGGWRAIGEGLGWAFFPPDSPDPWFCAVAFERGGPVDLAWAGASRVTLLDADGAEIAAREIVYDVFGAPDGEWRRDQWWFGAYPGGVAPAEATVGRLWIRAPKPARMRVRYPLRAAVEKASFTWRDVPLPRGPGAFAFRDVAPYPADPVPPDRIPAARPDGAPEGPELSLIHMATARGFGAAPAGRLALLAGVAWDGRPPAAAGLFSRVSYVTDAGERVDIAKTEGGLYLSDGSPVNVKKRGVAFPWPSRPARVLTQLALTLEPVDHVDEWATREAPLAYDADGRPAASRAGGVTVTPAESRFGYHRRTADPRDGLNRLLVRVDDELLPAPAERWQRYGRITLLDAHGREVRPYVDRDDGNPNDYDPASKSMNHYYEAKHRPAVVRVEYPTRGRREAHTFTLRNVPLPGAPGEFNLNDAVHRGVAQAVRAAGGYGEARPFRPVRPAKAEVSSWARGESANFFFEIPREALLAVGRPGDPPLIPGLDSVAAVAGSDARAEKGLNRLYVTDRAPNEQDDETLARAWRAVVSANLPPGTERVGPMSGILGFFRPMREITVRVEPPEPGQILYDRDGVRLEVEQVYPDQNRFTLKGRLPPSPWSWERESNRRHGSPFDRYRLRLAAVSPPEQRLSRRRENWHGRAGEDGRIPFTLDWTFTGDRWPDHFELAVANEFEPVEIPFALEAFDLPPDTRLPAGAPAGPRGAAEAVSSGIQLRLEEGRMALKRGLGRRDDAAPARLEGEFTLRTVAPTEAPYFGSPCGGRVSYVTDRGERCDGRQTRLYSHNDQPQPTGAGWSFTAPMPATPADRFTELTFTFNEVLFPAEYRVLEFPLGEDGQPRVLADAADVEVAFSPRDGGYAITVPASIYPESDQRWHAAARLQLLDGDGQEIETYLHGGPQNEWYAARFGGRRGSRVTRWTLAPAARGENAPTPARLRVELPVRGEAKELAFTLRDIPLPRRPDR